MKKLATSAMFLALAALSGSASARTFTIHGTICRPIPENLSSAEYDQYGVHNLSTVATLTVECPLPITYPESGPAPAVIQVQTTVYDRSTTDDVVCVLQQVNVNGAVLVSVLNQSSGGGPGTGSQDLPFNNLGADASGYWKLRCTLPSSSLGAYSHMVSASVQTAE